MRLRKPPSTTRFTPLMCLAAGLHRKAAAFATSSGVPSSPPGWFFCVAVAVYSEALILGLLIELPGFSPELLTASIRLALRVIS